MKGYDASRVELFTAIDKPALKALPDEPYAFAVWKRCRVAPDYHVEFDPPKHGRYRRLFSAAFTPSAVGYPLPASTPVAPPTKLPAPP